jgi:hypothetical protein
VEGLFGSARSLPQALKHKFIFSSPAARLKVVPCPLAAEGGIVRERSSRASVPFISRRRAVMNFLQKLLQGISFVPAIVNSIEGLFGGQSGQQKKDSAVSFVTAALQLTEAVANREIVDEAKFKEGLSKVIDGTVECLNASSWAQK